MTTNPATPSATTTITNEGIYKDEEGKNVHYNDRVSDQEEIRRFIEKIFNKSNHMNYKQYEFINHKVSSEMFYSLMAILHEKLPCAESFFRLKKKYRENHCYVNDNSPIRMIASPKMIRGLSITKGQRGRASIVGSYSPIRMSVPNFRNLKTQE